MTRGGKRTGAGRPAGAKAKTPRPASTSVHVRLGADDLETLREFHPTSPGLAIKTVIAALRARPKKTPV